MPQQPPEIHRKRRLVAFEITVIYEGIVMLNDCDDDQIESRIGDAVKEHITEDPLDYKSLTYKITDISNEDLTSNDYPQ